jgi:hypothetical protein
VGEVVVADEVGAGRGRHPSGQEQGLQCHLAVGPAPHLLGIPLAGVLQVGGAEGSLLRHLPFDLLEEIGTLGQHPLESLPVPSALHPPPEQRMMVDGYQRGLVGPVFE